MKWHLLLLLLFKRITFQQSVSNNKKCDACLITWTIFAMVTGKRTGHENSRDSWSYSAWYMWACEWSKQTFRVRSSARPWLGVKLDTYQRGLAPALRSFNKTDLNESGKVLMTAWRVCFNTVWVGGLMALGRDGALMYAAVNGCFNRTTNTFLFAIPRKDQIRLRYVFIQ